MAFKKGIIPWNKGQKAAPITAETRAKMSAAHTGHPSGMKGKIPWNKGQTKETDSRIATMNYAGHVGMSGKTHSPEAKAKISAALSGRKLSEETKEKLSEARQGIAPWNKGKPMPEETRNNVSDSKMGSIPWNRGREMAEEQRVKLSASKKGTHHPPWLKGRKASSETRAKLRDIRKTQWSDPDYRAKMLAILANNAKTEDTEIERLLDGAMVGAGLKPEKQYFAEGSKIDFTFPLLKIAIYVDGCYWHKCPTCNLSIGEKHALRINETPTVDKRITETLEAKDWLVLRFWGHEVLSEAILNEHVLPSILKSIARRSGSDVEKCDKNKLSIQAISNSEANQIVSAHHYLHRSVYIGKNISYKIVYEGKRGIGAVMFGYPIFNTKKGLVGQDTPIVESCCTSNPSRSACISCGRKFKAGGHLTESGFKCAGCMHGWVKNLEPLENGELVDLVRMWLPEDFPVNSESCAIGKAIRQLEVDWPKLTGKNVKAIITFVDTEFGHRGAIYKAASFISVGSVEGRKATPYEGHGRWNGSKDVGTEKRVYLRILDKSINIDVASLY